MATIIGITGSPRSGKTTEDLVKIALDAVTEKNNALQTELISLAGKTFAGCKACDYCRDNFNCVQQDDLSAVLERLKDEDIKGIIIGSPVYMGSMTSQIKAFLDRSVIFRRNGFYFKHKVGGAIAVGGSRHGGQDITLQTIHAALMIHDMIIVPDSSPTSHFGGAAWSKVEGGILQDPDALDTARNIGYNVAEIVSKLYL